MEPIISPIFIYLLSIVDSVRGVFSVLWWMNVICIALLIMFKGECENAKWVRYMRYNTISFIIAIVVAIFLPTKETLVAMYASKYVTIDNIKLGKEVVLDTIKDVVEIIDKKDEEGN